MGRGLQRSKMRTSLTRLSSVNIQPLQSLLPPWQPHCFHQDTDPFLYRFLSKRKFGFLSEKCQECNDWGPRVVASLVFRETVWRVGSLYCAPEKHILLLVPWNLNPGLEKEKEL